MSTRTRRTSTYDETAGWRSGGWGPVLSGAAAAFLTFITFSALWLAIAASGAGWVSGNLEWFELFTALGAAPVGGFVTGRLQPGDEGNAMARGFSSWGLVLLAGLVVGVPASTALFSAATNFALQGITTGGGVSPQLSAISSELWAAFVIFGGGGILAALASGAAARMGRSTRDETTTTTSDEVVDVTDRGRTREPVTSDRI